jgi:Tripartite tricarboxylate transporter TctB family.
MIGAIVVMTSMSKKGQSDKLASWDWISVLWVTGSVVLFGLILKPMGLIVSLAVLVFISAMASHEFHWKGTILNVVIHERDCLCCLYLGSETSVPSLAKLFNSLNLGEDTSWNY